MNHFLPHSDDKGSETSTSYTNHSLYLYEAMQTTYKAAIQYMEDNNLKIGNKFHVLFQGEADVKSASTWQTIYQRINNLLKNEYFMAADVDDTTIIDSHDLLYMKKHILGKINISKENLK